jgi:signal transduction histidine kinase
MIKPTQKRLTIVFTTVIVVFNALMLLISFTTLNRSLIKSLKSHMLNDVKDEYLAYVKSGDFKTLESLREDEYFQVFSRDGHLVSGTYKFSSFHLPTNEDLLAKAFSGKSNFETIKFNGDRYLVIYFPISDIYSGRVSLALTAMIEYEHNFYKLAILMMPVMLLVSYFMSRYLVRQAMKPIADVFDFQENFSSNVTHELRTPLASLKGNLEVALRKERNPDEYRQTLRLGLKEVDRIIELMNNLYMLAYSKFKPLEIVSKEANITAILEEAIASCKTRIDEKNITVDATGLSAVVCKCDESLMRRAIYNLIDNAVKYTPEYGTIRLELTNGANGLSFVISNTCERINRDEMVKLFEPFYRGENALSSNVEGKGLGLYIARYIIRSHGGDITIRASEDNMCTIVISHCGK